MNEYEYMYYFGMVFVCISPMWLFYILLQARRSLEEEINQSVLMM